METYTSNVSATENGDKAFSTSGDKCLDFFTRITRSAPFSDYVTAFDAAWKESKETAVRVLFNMRDVRGGKGEKLIPAVIMVCLKYSVEPAVYEAMLRRMVEYGYWKDLLRILEISNRTQMEISKKTILDTCPIEIKLFAEQLGKDIQVLRDSQTNASSTKVAISLCGKWAPSEKTHYDHHPIFAARDITNAMGLKPKEYRKMLTELRNHLGVLETLMSAQRYNEIDFSKLPSVAMMKMKHAFNRDANAEGTESEGRKNLHLSYAAYLKKLAEGKTKVNIKGIQPHELVSTYLSRTHELDQLVEGQWKALKERVQSCGAFRDVTAIVDVSGSMSGQPMEVAIALGILVAECTEGPFHGKVLTFHDEPSWYHLVGKNLMEQVQCMKSAPWGGSTNLRKTFDIILQDAVNGKLKQEEMVKTLFIFTDMQFNECGGYAYGRSRYGRSHLGQQVEETQDDGSWESTFEYAKRTFAERGYELPRIVCWNLRTSGAKTMPVTHDEKGVAMLSGFSAELLKCILTAQEFTPLAMMMHVLEPYQAPQELASSTVTDLVSSVPMTQLEAAVTKSAIKKAFKAQSLPTFASATNDSTWVSTGNDGTTSGNDGTTSSNDGSTSGSGTDSESESE